MTNYERRSSVATVAGVLLLAGLIVEGLAVHGRITAPHDDR